MIRAAFLAAAAAGCVSACGQPPQPTPHVDGQTITRAVQHAQAQVEQPARRERRK